MSDDTLLGVRGATTTSTLPSASSPASRSSAWPSRRASVHPSRASVHPSRAPSAARKPSRGTMIAVRTKILAYEPIVRATAARLRHLARATRVLDLDDLCAEGRVAVMEALRTYSGHGVPERVWVATRVRQRLIDVIRSHAVLSRREMRANKRAEEGEVVRRDILSLDASTDAGAPRTSQMPEPSGLTAEDVALAREMFERVREAMGKLSEKQRVVIEERILDDVPGLETGGRLGVSESRVSQIQKEAVEKLRRAMRSEPPREA